MCIIKFCLFLIIYVPVSYTHLDVYKRQYGHCDRNYTQHTFLECVRWAVEKQRLEMEVGPITPDNIVRIMSFKRNSWNQVAAFVEIVLGQKKNGEDQEHLT